MTESNASHTISLHELGQKYFKALQHLSDLTAYVWAGARSVNETAYDELSRGVAGLPNTPYRLSFETAKHEAERAWMKQSVSEVIGLSYVFIEDIRKLCGLVLFNATKASGQGDLTALAAELNKVPPPADLFTRLSEIRERYQLTTDLDEHMISLSKAARTLLHHNGVLGAEEKCDLKLKMITPPAEKEGQHRIADFEASWKPGERIYLNRAQHAAVFTTVSLFFSAMLTALQDYAKRSGAVQEPVHQ
ncbi:MAG TPA: hypothetical protein VNQ90_05610 [Chthoniobacteraceae bacterium]|nr:hypothetical protein [Chthoniobacteraceae bacterium]